MIITAGLDASPGGWACVVLKDGRFERALVLGTAAGVPDAEVVGVDIPIGLPESGARRADLEARKFVGARWASVWLTPPAGVLARPWAPGLGVSRQAHGMGARIREIAELGDQRFREVHPEVVFAFLAGGEPLPRKRTWAGVWRRVGLLRRHGVELPENLPLEVPADDLLDAAAVALSAHRIATGAALTLPADPKPGEPVICF